MKHSILKEFDQRGGQDLIEDYDNAPPKNNLFRELANSPHQYPESQYELDPEKVMEFISKAIEKAEKEAFNNVINKLPTFLEKEEALYELILSPNYPPGNPSWNASYELTSPTSGVAQTLCEADGKTIPEALSYLSVTLIAKIL